MKDIKIDKIPHEEFVDILKMIKTSRDNALKSVNTELINLYWNIGKYIDEKIEKSAWGKSVVKELSQYILRYEPDLKGFSSSNLWRMRQFYSSYKKFPKLAMLLREITWSNNLVIFPQCKTIEEKEFYINLTKKERWSFKELNRQISSSLFERTMLSETKISPTTQCHQLKTYL